MRSCHGFMLMTAALLLGVSAAPLAAQEPDTEAQKTATEESKKSQRIEAPEYVKKLVGSTDPSASNRQQSTDFVGPPEHTNVRTGNPATEWRPVIEGTLIGILPHAVVVQDKFGRNRGFDAGTHRTAIIMDDQKATFADLKRGMKVRLYKNAPDGDAAKIVVLEKQIDKPIGSEFRGYGPQILRGTIALVKPETEYSLPSLSIDRIGGGRLALLPTGQTRIFEGESETDLAELKAGSEVIVVLNELKAPELVIAAPTEAASALIEQFFAERPEGATDSVQIRYYRQRQPQTQDNQTKDTGIYTPPYQKQGGRRPQPPETVPATKDFQQTSIPRETGAWMWETFTDVYGYDYDFGGAYEGTHAYDDMGYDYAESDDNNYERPWYQKPGRQYFDAPGIKDRPRSLEQELESRGGLTIEPYYSAFLYNSGQPHETVEYRGDYPEVYGRYWGDYGFGADYGLRQEYGNFYRLDYNYRYEDSYDVGKKR